MNWNVINIEDVVRFLLILFRMGGLFLVAPLLSNKSFPRQVKLAMLLMTSFLLLPLVPFKPSSEILTSNLGLLILILQETTIGLVLGFVAYIAFSVITTAGEVFGMVIGFSIATVFDPANEGSSGVLTSLYVIIGGLIFLYLDGHHVMLSALVRSFNILPLGYSFNLQIGWSIVGIIAKIFMIAVQMAAPVLVVLTVLNIIFGVITKLSPQMNIYMNTGFIISPIVGMLILILSLPLFRVLLTHVTSGMGDDLVMTIRQLKGI